MTKKLKFVSEVLSVSCVEDDNHVMLFLHIADQGEGVYVGISYDIEQKDSNLDNLFCFDSAEMVDEFADKIKELLKLSKY